MQEALGPRRGSTHAQNTQSYLCPISEASPYAGLLLTQLYQGHRNEAETPTMGLSIGLWKVCIALSPWADLQAVRQPGY